MKYYIGRLTVFDEDHESASDCCIAAANGAQARTFLHEYAQTFVPAPSRLDDDELYRFEGYDVLAVKPHELVEVTPATFVDMQQLLPDFGAPSGDLENESQDERAKTLARRLGEQLKKLDAKVSHAKLLHAVAASLGETDWQVLVHKQQAQTAHHSEPEPAKDWPENGQTQPYIAGEGYLYQVPATVDATMTAIVKVRAQCEGDAMLMARKFAAEGNVKFEVDEGNYRGVADHYVSDRSAVYRLDDNEPAVPAQGDADMAQSGPYAVELVRLDDQDFFWADLSVYDMDEVEPMTESAMSCCPVEASLEERQQFCRRVAEMLRRAAPHPSNVAWRALQHAFIRAVQGDQSDETFTETEAELRKGT